MMFFVVYTENKNDILEQLYEKYKYLMYHISYDILKDNALAEDTVQSAFLKLTNTNFEIDDVNSNKTRSFMVIITRNIAFDIYNKRKRENIIYIDDDINEVPDEGLPPTEIVLNKINISEVAQALKKMDEKYSDVIILRYFYNLNDAEISNLLGITEQLIRVRLHRARKILVNKMTGDA